MEEVIGSIPIRSTKFSSIKSSRYSLAGATVQKSYSRLYCRRARPSHTERRTTPCFRRTRVTTNPANRPILTTAVAAAPNGYRDAARWPATCAKTAKTRSWEKAETLCRRLEDESDPNKPEARARAKIVDAIKTFRDDEDARGLTDSTVQRSRVLLRDTTEGVGKAGRARLPRPAHAAAADEVPLWLGERAPDRPAQARADGLLLLVLRAHGPGYRRTLPSSSSASRLPRRPPTTSPKTSSRPSSTGHTPMGTGMADTTSRTAATGCALWSC